VSAALIYARIPEGMNRLSLSIVTPSLNVQPHLEACLASVASQDRADFEHIVVDGGSTDGTVELLSSWKAHPLRWVSEPDRGQAHAINKGFAMAQGDILAWLNADDLYEPWTVRRVLHHFESTQELDFLYGLAVVIDANGAFVRVAPQPRPQLSDLYRFSPFLHQPAVFFRRSVLDRFGFLDEALYFAMDYEYWLRVGRDVSALFVPELLARIRQRPGSKMADPGWRRFYREMRRCYLRHGGRRFSPMLLERWLNRGLEYPVYMLTWPLRKILWKLMDVPWGRPFRMR
jgi:glycosyltransferase involved in cell wall biosynthesis